MDRSVSGKCPLQGNGALIGDKDITGAALFDVSGDFRSGSSRTESDSAAEFADIESAFAGHDDGTGIVETLNVDDGTGQIEFRTFGDSKIAGGLQRIGSVFCLTDIGFQVDQAAGK